MDKKSARIRRSRKTRAHIAKLGVDRLSVFRTPQHIYAQITTAGGEKVLAVASTVQKEVKDRIEGHSGNVASARVVGQVIAEKAKAAGIESVAFDRAGFRYHGRIKALAEAAREAGLRF